MALQKVKNVFPVGGWVSPPSAAAGGADYVNEERYREIAEAGINLIYTHQDRAEHFDDIVRMAACAQETGVYLMVGDESLYKNKAPESRDAFLRFCAEHPAVAGVCVYDEPGIKMFDSLTALYARVQPWFRNIAFYMNALPMYATPGQLGGGFWTERAGEEATEEEYEQYIERFCDMGITDILSFDFYPFRHEKGVCDPRFFTNLSLCRAAARKRGMPLWNFIQVTSWNTDAIRNATYSEILWQVSSSLAYGVKGIQYFCYWTPCDANGEFFADAMLSRRGEKTKSYYYVQDINRHVREAGKYLLTAEHKGVIAMGDTLVRVPAADRLQTFGDIAALGGEGALIGCFTRGGKDMYYIVNTSLFETRRVQLRFSAAHLYTEVRKNVTGTLCVGEYAPLLQPGEGVLLARID